jgi:argininosuccinate lyase
MKLWNKKGTKIDHLIQVFTVGNDRELDLKLAKYDVIASVAHAEILLSINILNKKELYSVIKVLDEVLISIQSGDFIIEDDFEDVHSKLEYILTEELGETGKKIHTGRSRNDQVMVDLCLYFKDEILYLKNSVKELFDNLITLSDKYKDHLLPGYTHMQIAMPSSFGMWFGAYAESLIDDVYLFNASFQIADQNPLGSAAGYGSSFPIDRKATTEKLEFGNLKVNSIASQMARGKVEKSLAFAMSSLAGTLSKMALDICTYMGQNFGFIAFPDHLTTGSSIMPHKKNPDVWELIRAKCNRIQALPNELIMIQNNLGSGYHRDFQILKDSIFPRIEDLKSCLALSEYMLDNIQIKGKLLDDPRYEYLFSVEAVNKLVLDKGLSFREAYQLVGDQVNDGSYKADKKVSHTHIGSIGNLGNGDIIRKMDDALC